MANPEHPHGRGEKGASQSIRRRKRGTSPRAWGEVVRVEEEDERVRNIPTGVGRRPRRARSSVPPTEHPHGRGEKGSTSAYTSESRGTSPRAWGEAPGCAVDVVGVRNIPTGVGRSPGRARRGAGGAEHPHGRGEKSLLPRRQAHPAGTSPRAWGEEPPVDRVDDDLRNIPTGVGRRCIWPGRRRPCAEHPHGRGEKSREDIPVRPASGTSPRAWGEERSIGHAPCQPRNIPTGVGRRSSVSRPHSWRTEHPHGRGEKIAWRASRGIRAGTSPRAWGEGYRIHGEYRRYRNIPTGVGRRAIPTKRACGHPEHPHGRGEKSLSLLDDNRDPGTSPRAWGEGPPFAS